MMKTLTWTIKIKLIRQDDEYNEKENIILAYKSCIITFKCDQFERGCYKYILV